MPLICGAAMTRHVQDEGQPLAQVRGGDPLQPPRPIVGHREHHRRPVEVRDRCRATPLRRSQFRRAAHPGRRRSSSDLSGRSGRPAGQRPLPAPAWRVQVGTRSASLGDRPVELPASSQRQALARQADVGDRNTRITRGGPGVIDGQADARVRCVVRRAPGATGARRRPQLPFDVPPRVGPQKPSGQLARVLTKTIHRLGIQDAPLQEAAGKAEAQIDARRLAEDVERGFKGGYVRAPGNWASSRWISGERNCFPIRSCSARARGSAALNARSPGGATGRVAAPAGRVADWEMLMPRRSMSDWD